MYIFTLTLCWITVDLHMKLFTYIQKCPTPTVLTSICQLVNVKKAFSSTKMFLRIMNFIIRNILSEDYFTAFSTVWLQWAKNCKKRYNKINIFLHFSNFEPKTRKRFQYIAVRKIACYSEKSSFSRNIHEAVKADQQLN